MKRVLISAVAAIALFGLTACTGSGFFSNPQNDLNIAEAGFSTALALYNSICEQNANLGVCTPDNLAKAASLEKAVTDAIQAAEVLIGASQAAVGGSTPTPEQIASAIQAVTNAVTDFNSFVNQLQVKKASLAAARAH